jgi:methyl-accepting chemotaxis protein
MDKKPTINYVVWCVAFGLSLFIILGAAYWLLNTRLDSAKQLLEDQQTIFVKINPEKAKEQEFIVKAEIANAQNRQNMAMGLMLLAAVIATVGGWLMAKRMSVGLTELFEDLDEIMHDHTLSVRVRTSPGPFAEVGETVNHLLERAHSLIRNVRDFSTRLSDSAANVLETSKDASIGLEKQLAETDKVAVTINQMSETVQEVARNTNSAADAAKEAREEASSGQLVVTDTMKAIQLLADEVQTASDVIQRLSNDSNNIGSVLDVIRGISDQTNLLALNAAIEAARAGEAGRGFAVVADEVRTLAKRTGESTEEIQKMIERLQTGASEAVKVMEQGRSRAHNSVAQASKAGNSLNSITASVQKISELNTHIASAADEQSKVAEDIHGKVVTIGNLCKTSSTGVNEALNACKALSSLVAELIKVTAAK